jgi:hypothetical protein
MKSLWVLSILAVEAEAWTSGRVDPFSLDGEWVEEKKEDSLDWFGSDGFVLDRVLGVACVLVGLMGCRVISSCQVTRQLDSDIVD